MEVHGGVDPQFTQGRDQRAARLEFPDAGRRARAESGLEESGVVAPEQPPARIARAARHAADAGPQVAKHTPRERASPMGGRDEDEAPHFRQALVDERLAQEPDVLRRAGHPGGILRADRPPELRPGRLRGHLRHQSPEAVTDDNQVVERRVGTAGVEGLLRPAYRPPEPQGRERDRVSRRVAEGPELVPAADRLVSLEVPDHPVPLPLAAPEAVDEDDGDLAALIGTEDGQPCRVLPRVIDASRRRNEDLCRRAWLARDGHHEENTRQDPHRERRERAFLLPGRTRATTQHPQSHHRPTAFHLLGPRASQPSIVMAVWWAEEA